MIFEDLSGQDICLDWVHKPDWSWLTSRELLTNTWQVWPFLDFTKQTSLSLLYRRIVPESSQMREVNAYLENVTHYINTIIFLKCTHITKDAENFVTEMSQVICKIYTPSNVVLKYQPSELLVVFHFFKQQDVVLCNWGPVRKSYHLLILLMKGLSIKQTCWNFQNHRVQNKNTCYGSFERLFGCSKIQNKKGENIILVDLTLIQRLQQI